MPQLYSTRTPLSLLELDNVTWRNTKFSFSMSLRVVATPHVLQQADPIDIPTQLTSNMSIAAYGVVMERSVNVRSE